MAKIVSVKGLFKLRYKLLSIGGVWRLVIGSPEIGGAWLVYGHEKNGKTAVSVNIADELANLKRTLYVSAEEGLSSEIRENCRLQGIDPNRKNLQFADFLTIDDLRELLIKRQGPKFVIIDNITVYVDELRNNRVRKLLAEFPGVTFIFIAHEERNEPYTATARMIKKLAKVIIHVQGFKAFVSGRCPGGEINIAPNLAALYHGTEQKTTN